jgi:hypothetical protein
MSIASVLEMNRYFYREQPEQIPLYYDFPSLLLKSVDYNCLPSKDRYAWFRKKYGPVHLPFIYDGNDRSFFTAFMTKLVESGFVMNMDSFDDSNGDSMTYDLLELLNHLHHALVMYDNNRICGASHPELLQGPDGS